MRKEYLTDMIKASAVLKGILTAVAVSLILSAIIGVVYHFSSITGAAIPWLTVVILAVGAFSGALITGKDVGNKGLYYGLATGLVFFLVILLAAKLFMPGQSALGIVYKLLITAAAGTVGGIIGVGLS